MTCHKIKRCDEIKTRGVVISKICKLSIYFVFIFKRGVNSSLDAYEIAAVDFFIQLFECIYIFGGRVAHVRI